MTGMIGPVWLAATVGVVMLACTVYAVVRIVVAWRTGRATDYSIEVCHAVMGVSMAGMLIPGLHIVEPGISTWIWVAISALITIGFAISVVRDITTSEPDRIARFRRLHHLPHLVLSGAMVYMLAVSGIMASRSEMHPSISGMSSMSGMTSSGLVPWATVDLALALFLTGYTILLVDRLPAIATVGGVGRPFAVGAHRLAPLYAPRGAVVLGIVMAFGMTYMLIMMFA